MKNKLLTENEVRQLCVTYQKQIDSLRLGSFEVKLMRELQVHGQHFTRELTDLLDSSNRQTVKALDNLYKKGYVNKKRVKTALVWWAII